MDRMRDQSRRPASLLRRLGCITLGALALTLATVLVASAHDTWLISATNFGRVGVPFRLGLTSGETFPTDDFAIVQNRITRAIVREAGVTRQLPRPTGAALRLEYLWTPHAAGVASLGIELQPKTLVLDPRLIDEYLGEIDASDAIRATWKALGDKQKWTESYTKHAMTFVRIAPAKSDSAWIADKSWMRPLGLVLEMLPGARPDRAPRRRHARRARALARLARAVVLRWRDPRREIEGDLLSHRQHRQRSRHSRRGRPLAAQRHDSPPLDQRRDRVGERFRDCDAARRAAPLARARPRCVESSRTRDR